MNTGVAGPAMAIAARDAALAQVERHAHTEWLRLARDVIDDLAATGLEFTSDDVWAAVGSPREPRALGVVFRHAAQAGVIVSSGRYRKSTRPECHARPLLVWSGGQPSVARARRLMAPVKLSAALRRDLAAVLDGTATEAAFQRVVVRYAKDHGWLVHHTPKAKIRPGKHITPTVGHIGFPDLTMCRAGRLLLIELKSKRGVESDMQRLWANRLVAVPGIEVYLWWPQQFVHTIKPTLF